MVQEQLKQEADEKRINDMAEKLASQMFQRLQRDYADKMYVEQNKLATARAEAEEQKKLASEAQAELKAATEARLLAPGSNCDKGSSGSGAGEATGTQSSGSGGAVALEISKAGEAPTSVREIQKDPSAIGSQPNPVQQAGAAPPMEQKEMEPGDDKKDAEKNDNQASPKKRGSGAMIRSGVAIPNSTTNLRTVLSRKLNAVVQYLSTSVMPVI